MPLQKEVVIIIKPTEMFVGNEKAANAHLEIKKVIDEKIMGECK